MGNQLTDFEIQAARPKDKEYSLHDGDGLYLRIKPKGTKLWKGEYWLAGKRMSIPLGSYPQVSLKQARKDHIDVRYHASKGTDPKKLVEERQKAILDVPGKRSSSSASDEEDETIPVDELTPESTFRSLALAWFQHWKIGKASKHVSRSRQRLTDNIFPTLGTLRIKQVEAPDIVRMARAIERRLGRPTDLAQRSIQTVGQIMRYGLYNAGVVRRDPSADIKPCEVLLPVPENNQARVEEADVPALLVAMDEYTGRVIVKHAAQLMLLVFLRTVELIGARWKEIDLEQRMWRVPRERMKKVRGQGQQAKGAPHLIPLSNQAVEVLKRLQEYSDNTGFIFPGVYSKSGHIHPNSILEMLEDIGFKGEQTGHGFRGIASTILHERGYSDAVIDAQLAHLKRSKVKRAYDYAQYLPQRRELLQGWADYVDEARERGYAARRPPVEMAAD